MRIHLLAIGFLSILLTLPSCGGGGGGGGSAANADVLIGDAPVDDLLSFSAVVQSVRLQRDDLSFTGDLAGSLEIEFLGLNGALAFLAKGRIAPGTYVAVEIGFVPGSYQAKADDSSPVVIVPATNTYLAPLAVPLVVAAGDYVRFTVDLDLLSSLSGLVSDGSLDFDPSGTCHSDDGSEDEPIDELRGRVQSFDADAHTILVDASVGEPPSRIGNVTLLVTGATSLLDNDNAPLSLSNFFARLAAGTFLEVHGNLGADGLLTATRIEIEDGGGGGGGSAVARIRGIVAALAPPQLSLRITQIKDGASVVEPVLEGLENHDVIAVGFGEGTAFMFDDGGLTTSASLDVGQEITVRFSAFVAPPFPAREIEIDDSPGFHATLSGPDRAGALRVRLDTRDPAARAAGTNGEAILALGSTPIVLDVPGSPVLAASELRPGLALEVHGRLGGPPAAPVLSAERVLVHPGYLRGASLADVAPGGGNFVVDGGAFVDPFGTGVTPGPLLMWTEEGCTFEGDAHSRAEFEALARAGGGRVTLDVRGLANGVANEVRAFAVRVRRE